jgi:endonuclease/exonuclease/phosphatase family metal-dependent hydrolase
LHAAADAFVPPTVPLIVGGDMNDDPGSVVWTSLEARGRDAWANSGSTDDGTGGVTSSVALPLRRIDGVFVDPRLTLLRTEVINTADVQLASDHRPVLVEIEFRRPSGPESEPANHNPE